MPTLTLPEIVTFAPQPYLAIAERVRVPFNATVDRVVSELFVALEAKGIEPAGPLFFKYNPIAMPELDLESGVPTRALESGDAHVRAGTPPGGRYASVTYHGHYDRLREVNAIRERSRTWSSGRPWS